MKIRLGVDIACRAAHQASCADERGEMLFVGHRFHTDPDELDTLWARLPQDCEVTVVMEPTRNAWVALAAWFRRHGASVVMVPPEQSADLRSYYNKHAKTDRLDSRVLARLPRPGPKSRLGERHCLSARSQEATRLIARGRGVERARRRGHQGRRGIRTPRCSHRPLGQSQLGEQLKRAADRFAKSSSKVLALVDQGAHALRLLAVDEDSPGSEHGADYGQAVLRLRQAEWRGMTCQSRGP